MSCLFAAAFVMKADVLHQTSVGTVENPDGDWQDPLSGETYRNWQPGDNPDTPEVEVDSIDCDIRPLIGNTARFGGDTEQFAKQYSDSAYAIMKFSPRVIVTKRDRITNVRNRDGIIWRELEMDKVNGEYRATVFDVIGMRPVLGPFGELMAYEALLQRAEVQA